MLVLDDKGLWPDWHAPLDVSRRVDDGYGHIACFASPQTLRPLAAAFPDGVRFRVADGTLTPAQLDEHVARELYRQVCRQAVPYAPAPWVSGGGQRVRDPQWLLSPGSAGNCLDLSLLFAALCVREGVAVSLVMLRSGGGADNHVVVAVHPGCLPADLPRPRGTAAEPSPGVYRLRSAQDLIDDGVLLLDVTAAGSAAGTFDQARLDPDVLAPFTWVHLVDVVRRHLEGDGPLPPPELRRALDVELPPPVADRLPFATHERILADLRDRRGVVVLRGLKGTGKSTLALAAAATVEGGHGWFLRGTNTSAYKTSLAEMEQYERGDVPDSPDSIDADALATAAIQRLSDAREVWVAVVDNADSGPQHVRSVLDRASDRQLVIVTSTADASEWADYPQIIEVPPLSDAEIAEHVPDPRLRRASAGTTLLLRAFAQLAQEHPGVLDELADVDTAEDGAQELWRLSSDRISKPAVRLVQAAAWLSPDHLPTPVLATVAGDAATSVKELEHVGLLVGRGDETWSLHRLIGGAVRDSMRSDGSDVEQVVDLVSRPAIQELLVRYGDRDVTRSLRDALGDDPPRQPVIGPALCAIAALQEVHEGVRTAADTFAVAAQRLDPGIPGEDHLLAACLHGQARVVYQGQRPSLDQIVKARKWMAKAMALRAGDVVGLATHEALDALLQKAEAQFAPWHSDERIATLRESLRRLEHSYDVRAATPDADPRLVDRGSFNRAGASIDLAQQVLDEAPGLLDAADAVYRSTLAFRRERYGQPNPLAAACVLGHATVAYYRYVLEPAMQRPEAKQARCALLERATELTLAALGERQLVAAGERENNDTAKCHRLLAKISAARFAELCKPADLADLNAELGRELGVGADAAPD